MANGLVGRIFGRSFVASAVLGGGCLGAFLGSYLLSGFMAGVAVDRFDASLRTVEKVDAKAFIRSHAPNVANSSVDKQLREVAERIVREGHLKPEDIDGFVRHWRQQEPFNSTRAGTNAYFAATYGVVTAEEMNPNILAHELGHSRQHAVMDDADYDSYMSEYATYWGTLTGKQLAIEEDAWVRARAFYRIDPNLETSALNTYRFARAGLAGGAVGGFGLGAGAVSLVLVWLTGHWARASRKAGRRHRRAWASYQKAG